MSYETMVKTIPSLTYEQQVDLMGIILQALKTHQSSDMQKHNYSNEYPSGFFDLFGSDKDYDVDEPGLDNLVLL